MADPTIYLATKLAQASLRICLLPFGAMGLCRAAGRAFVRVLLVDRIAIFQNDALDWDIWVSWAPQSGRMANERH
jgi:hypothetical protein